MSTAKKTVYGVAAKAWHPLIGCDPHNPCAPRCWARKTIARVVECQKERHPERAVFFQQVLTPNGRQWSGRVLLDDVHLADPLHWARPALVATGFHGDVGRLSDEDKLYLFQQIGKCPRHTVMLLTKEPASLLHFLERRRWRLFGSQPQMLEGTMWAALIPGEHREDDATALPNVTIGCSVMNQTEADRMVPAMRALHVLGWRPHVWYEPALGPVDWTAWKFVERIICGGESGPGSRPMYPDWARATRDFCQAHKIAFAFKQWGDWIPSGAGDDSHLRQGHKIPDRSVGPERVRWVYPDGTNDQVGSGDPSKGNLMLRAGKSNADCLLDGREWKQMPEVRR